MKESFYSWNEYSFKFTQKAQGINISENVILELLLYAENLNFKKVPIIYDIKHLSYLTEYREEYILRSIKRPQNFYRTFEIAKRNGNKRKITEPLPGLKSIQYWILNNIIKTVPLNKFNNAYSKGKSIITNAKYHTKQRQILNLDIEKFFDNITFDLVFVFFKNLGYNAVVANCLTSLCTLNGGLPQGSPSSPYLSSILTSEIDDKLFAYCRSYNLRYSRYADDISISGNFHPGTIISGVRGILKQLDFNLNERKTKVKQRHQQQIVTGIVVNQALSIRKKELRDIRQIMYYIKKYGIESHVIKIEVNKSNYIEHLLGRVNFFLAVKKNNPDLLDYKEYLITLLKQLRSIDSNL